MVDNSNNFFMNNFLNLTFIMNSIMILQQRALEWENLDISINIVKMADPQTHKALRCEAL